MKKLFVMGLACNVLALQAMVTRDNVKQIVTADRVTQEFAQMQIHPSGASVDIAALMAPLSYKEYHEITEKYLAFLGKNRVTVEVGKSDFTIDDLDVAGVPGCTVQKTINILNTQKDITEYNDEYRKMICESYSKKTTLTRKQVLGGVARILAIRDQTEELGKQLNGSNSLKITFFSITDNDGDDNGSITTTARSMKLVDNDNKCEKKLAKNVDSDYTSTALVAAGVAVGSYVCYRAVPAFRECVQRLYRAVMCGKTRTAKDKLAAKIQKQVAVAVDAEPELAPE